MTKDNIINKNQISNLDNQVGVERNKTLEFSHEIISTTNNAVVPRNMQNPAAFAFEENANSLNNPKTKLKQTLTAIAKKKTKTNSKTTAQTNNKREGIVANNSVTQESGGKSRVLKRQAHTRTKTAKSKTKITARTKAKAKATIFSRCILLAKKFANNLKQRRVGTEITVKKHLWSITLFYTIAVAAAGQNIYETFCVKPRILNLKTQVAALESREKLYLLNITNLEKELSDVANKDFMQSASTTVLQQSLNGVADKESIYVAKIVDLEKQLGLLETNELKFLAAISELEKKVADKETQYLASLKAVNMLRSEVETSKKKLEASTSELKAAIVQLKHRDAQLQQNSKTLSAFGADEDEIITTPKFIKKKVTAAHDAKLQDKLDRIEANLAEEYKKIAAQREHINSLSPECDKVNGIQAAEKCIELETAKETLSNLERKITFIKAKESALLQKLELNN